MTTPTTTTINDNELDLEAVLAEIDEQLNNHPVILYMKGTREQPQCGFSNRAIQVLNACGVEYFTVDILDPKNENIRANLRHHPQSKWPTFPQLFINGELIGGSDMMLEEYESGELQAKLAVVK